MVYHYCDNDIQCPNSTLKKLHFRDWNLFLLSGKTYSVGHSQES
jgi:hypothetical protein